MYLIMNQLCSVHSVNRNGFGNKTINLLFNFEWRKKTLPKSGIIEHSLNQFGAASLEV